MTGNARSRLPIVAMALAAVAVAGCGSADPLRLTPAPGPAESSADESPEVGAPSGVVRVAYPDVPGDWSGSDPVDTAAIDLAALWSLSLFSYDPDGQLVPRLVREVTFPSVPEGWAVDLALADGVWTDGTEVTAEDVVGTVEALREARPEEWRVVRSAAVLDSRQVRLHFAEPYGRWAHLLAAVPGVLPRSVVDAGGLEAYREPPTVTAGPFSLTEYEAGRSATFEAHLDGPLGPPGLERVEVLFVPSYETALGLLDRGEVDVVLGHLALNPVARAERLAGVSAAAPLGGTTVSVEWLASGSLGGSAEARRNAIAAIDVSELVAGLLSGIGTPATSPVPGIDGPFDAGTTGRVAEPIEREVVLLVPRWHEAVGFTSRAVQRDLTAAGGVARLVSVGTPDLLDPVDPHDGALRIRRWSPRPALGAAADRTSPAPADLLAVDLAPAFAELHELGWESPLYRIGVAHAWTDEVAGVEPSSWPGLGLWNVGEWTRDDGA